MGLNLAGSGSGCESGILSGSDSHGLKASTINKLGLT